MSGWIDISVPLRSGMARWPGDPPVEVERISDMAAGGKCNVSRMACAVHAGTHVDAPLHFRPRGAAIDEMPVDALMGPARVIAIADTESIKRGELEQHAIGAGERILFRTANSTRCWRQEGFCEDYVHVSADAARYLAGIGPLCVGIDYLSVGGYRRGGMQTHIALLRAGIWLIEGLDLSLAAPGHYELICLPLRLAGADGAPARAILQRQPA